MSNMLKGAAGGIVRNGALGLVGRAITGLTGLAQLILVGRWLGPEALGAFALLTAAPMMVQQFLGFRTGEFVTKFTSLELNGRFPVRARFVVAVGCVLDFTVTLFAGAGIGILGHWYLRRVGLDTGCFSVMIIYVAALLVSSPITSLNAALRSAEQFALQIRISIVSNIIRFVVTVLSCYYLPTEKGLVYGSSVSQILGCLAGCAFVVWKVPAVWPAFGRGLMRFARKSGRSYRQFLSAGYVEASLLALSRNVDSVLLGAFGSVADVGLYRTAQGFVGQTQILLLPLMSAVLPELQRNCANDPRWLCDFRNLRPLIWLGVALGGAIGGSLLLCGWLAPVLLGPRFAGTVGLIHIMAVSPAVTAASFWMPTVFLCNFWVWRKCAATLCAVAVQLLAMGWLIKYLGTTGAAIAYITTGIVQVALMAAWIWRHYRKEWNLRGCSRADAAI